MRQALLTSCLGSTTSTRGSLIATSFMHDISKPYTFSHPDRCTNKSQFSGKHALFQSIELDTTEYCRFLQTPASQTTSYLCHSQAEVGSGDKSTYSGFCSPCTACLRWQWRKGLPCLGKWVHLASVRVREAGKKIQNFYQLSAVMAFQSSCATAMDV